MQTNVPYLPAVGNIPKILAKMQSAGAPDNFNVDFLRDLGFQSSQDRPFGKFLKFIGFLDAGGKPQTSYLEFLDHTRGKKVLAARLRAAFDDLFVSDRNAQNKSSEELKGWFKSKTGESDAVAKKMASTFKAFATYADFTEDPPAATPSAPVVDVAPKSPTVTSKLGLGEGDLSFVYRIEIHLPDTQNIETFRAIFRALREELVP